jgi:hypothetical protein
MTECRFTVGTGVDGGQLGRYSIGLLASLAVEAQRCGALERAATPQTLSYVLLCGGKLAVMQGQTVHYAVVPLPGGLTAVFIAYGSLQTYRHPDWLGSGRVDSAPNGGLYR